MQVGSPTRDDVDDDQAYSLVEIGSTLDRECLTLLGPVLIAGTDQFNGRYQGESRHRREDAHLEGIRKDGRYHLGRRRGRPSWGESHGRAHRLSLWWRGGVFEGGNVDFQMVARMS